MADTHRLWNKIKDSEFEVVISNVAGAEIDACRESKRDILNGYLRD
jgi:hypothetical protein